MQYGKSDRMAFTSSILSIIAALSALAGGCIPTLNDNTSVTSEPELGIPAANGLSVNGLGINGLGINGLGINGLGINGLGINGLGINGLRVSDVTVAGAVLTNEQQAQLQTLLKYMVECALPAGESVFIHNEHGIATVLHGLLGFSPEWADGAMSVRGQHLVSACLAARTNANAQTVRISLRGADLPTSEVERAIYSRHEGAFWGNLFADDPYIKTCYVDGAGISGRVCTSGACGFVDAGHCTETCSKQNNLDGHYSNCEGQEEVLNVFLSITDGVAFGKEHSCLRQEDGSLDCWGRNNNGQLGNGSQSDALHPTPVTSLGTDVAEVAGGRRHTCARTVDGAVYCWGDNNQGQVGSGSADTEILAPAHVTKLEHDVASLSVGHEHSCAIRTDGTLWCWGDNFYGQLGNGNNENQSTPILIDTLGMDVARVSLGDCADHTCAVTNDGNVYCWGWNDAGQLGNGTVASSTEPVQITTDDDGNVFTDVTDLCTGWLHTCARKSDGEVWCWGSNDENRLGNPNVTSGVVSRPVQVALAGEVIQGGLSCAMDHTCAVLRNGDVHCWGGNEYGQLGSGSYEAEVAPSKVSGLNRRAISVSTDSSHTCATLDDNSLWCWGQDEGNMLFDSTTSAVPVLVAQ